MREFYIPLKSAGGFHDESISARFFLNRELWLDSAIDDDSALLLAKQILLLGREDPNTPITLYICSGGGAIQAGMLIYDAIRGSAAPVRTVVCGEACSMAAVLMCAGTGGRYILSHSRMMLHEPLLGSKVGGNVTSIREISKSLEKAKADIDEILVLHTGKTPEEIAEATGGEHYFSAEEAVDFGLADRIVTMEELMKGEF